jgi:colicin import membrane protein
MDELRARDQAVRYMNQRDAERLAKSVPESSKAEVEAWQTARKAAADLWLAVADKLAAVEIGKPVEWAEIDALKHPAYEADGKVTALHRHLECEAESARFSRELGAAMTDEAKAKLAAFDQAQQKALDAEKALQEADAQRKVLAAELRKLADVAQAKAKEDQEKARKEAAAKKAQEAADHEKARKEAAGKKKDKPAKKADDKPGVKTD